jgi:hypothetical protein
VERENYQGRAFRTRTRSRGALRTLDKAHGFRAELTSVQADTAFDDKLVAAKGRCLAGQFDYEKIYLLRGAAYSSSRRPHISSWNGFCLTRSGSCTIPKAAERLFETFDQGIFNSSLEQRSAEELRQQILRGAYRLIDRAPSATTVSEATSCISLGRAR